ncbi:MAG: gliding motility-associated ABC transporter substrate-binding protein GldG [Bacteroidia bacterium]|nr:gliding motility-associated ABC transporter substrate-binding protein GldG [Bacteroidia bacterium]
MKNIQANLQWIIIIGIIVILNLILSNFFFRIDLTKEGRYSLSPLTKETVKEFTHPVLVSIYLEGEFPPNVREFQDAIRTTLLEMKQYAGDDLQFQFIDPTENPELQKSLVDRGLSPIPIRVRVSASEIRTNQMWPVLEVFSNEREIFVDLVKGASVMTTQGPNINFAKAEADLEYKITSAMRKLNQKRGGVVAFLQGHGELPPDSIPELVTEITNNYNLFTFDLQKVPDYSISPTVDVLVILQPKRAFSERDKYEIDQYLMRGGSILWMLDNQLVDLSLYRNQSTLSELRELNLDDMFFKYGFKLNYDLVQDMECEPTEIVVPGPSGRASFESRKWIFYPMMLQFPDHPISRNVDATLMRYANSIDTFSIPGTRREVFLKTSRLSRTVQGKQFIDINDYLQNQPPQSLFNKADGVITGLLVEGVFQSLFQNRKPPVDSIATKPPTALFGPQNNPAYPGSLAIISDGEFAQGKKFRNRRGFIPYDNKALIMNALDYLSGDKALTDIRSKEVGVRRINREKASKFPQLLRITNLLLPVLLVVIFGFIRFYLRRRKNLNRKA